MFFTRNIFTGDVNAKKDLLAIKESVKNIILTNTHERPFDSEFGTNATIGMFENINDFSFYVENNISVAIALYETRVNLTNITSSMTDRSVSINIEYKHCVKLKYRKTFIFTAPKDVHINTNNNRNKHSNRNHY